MRKLSILALAGALVATPAAAEGVFGLWKTQTNDKGVYLKVETYDCDGKICGKIVENVGGEMQEIVGRLIIEDMEPNGANSWDNGTIWKPDDDETYDSEMTLDGDVLTVSGCILFGSVCRSQDWTRLE